MSLFVVDVEADSPSPATGSIISIGVVLVRDMNCTFYGELAPITNQYMQSCLDYVGVTRQQHKTYDEPKKVMIRLEQWLNHFSSGKPEFLSDNPAYDFKWIDFYFHKYLNRNPFGYSARRIGDLYCGMVKDAGRNREWKKKYRKTKHDHNPVNDAKGNAEALWAMRDKLGLKIRF